MNDLGQALEAKVEIITKTWIEAVHRDSEIESAKKLAYEAVRNSLPDILKELAGLLSDKLPGSEKELEQKSLCHGLVRASQGFDTAEIVREYRLLRQTILLTLEPDLLSGSAQEVLDSVRLIDQVFDEVITNSVESYIESRLIELQQLQSQLTLTNQELVRLVQVQKDNLSYMAHELKTPLNSIIGYSSVLLQKQRKQVEKQDSVASLDQLERVLRNGRRLLQIINDTLEISRYDQGLIRLNIMPVRAGSVIREILQDGLEPLALEKELDLMIDVDRMPDIIMTDSLRIQQLVTNLVSNAIRYTEEGSIQVICQPQNEQFWEIQVIDTGIGIEEEAKGQIFEPYIRSNSQEPSISGTGLGLAIVKSIVSLMNGNIELASEVNVGSTFKVVLPLTLPE
ncbi:MAG: sensor histidine kinase [Cyanobacteria bacterium P01_C01_bin.120]